MYYTNEIDRQPGRGILLIIMLKNLPLSRAREISSFIEVTGPESL